MGIILLIVATVLAIIFVPVGFVYSMFVLLWRNGITAAWNKINDYLYILALGIDQLGNVAMLPGAYRFGNPDQTLSYIFGKNKQLGKLNWMGLFIARVLDWLDPNHTDKAVKHEEDAFDNHSSE
jgi:hypothetical protein